MALGGAALIMALTSAGNTALPLLLGRLVDFIPNANDPERPRTELYEGALVVLGLIALVYVVREALNVIAPLSRRE